MPESVASYVRFTTTADGAEDFAALLTGLVEYVNAEAGTTTWIAARSEQDPCSCFLVDVFAGAGARTTHFEGEAAAVLRERAPELLASPPEIVMLELLAGKNV